MLFSIVKELFICLIITIVIEYIPIVIFLQIPRKYFIAVNVLTNVVANVVILIYDILEAKKSLPITRLQLIIVIEVIVCIVEILLYYAYIEKKNSKNQKISFDVNDIVITKELMTTKIVIVTILANVLSFTLGTMILIAIGG